MKPGEADLNAMLGLFAQEKKKDLERYCRDLVVTHESFVSVILAGLAGAMPPYHYARHFFDYVPEGLDPTDEEREALSHAKVGEPLGGAGARFFRKIEQITIQRRLFSAHLFYTPNREFWYLFYFDQRDRDGRNPHWKHGAHIHLVTHHFNFKLEEVWKSMEKGDAKFSKLHIRYFDKDRVPVRQARSSGAG